MHDFHLWSISAEKPILTAHVVTQHPAAFALFEITKMLQSEFDIHHSTIQIEPNPHHGKGERYGVSNLIHCINEFNFSDASQV